MSELIRLSHNVSLLIYHFVCPAKYRRIVFDVNVDEELKNVWQEIEKRYDIRFLEIGTDRDHVHFLVQSIPKVSGTQIIRTIKRITAREIFQRCPQVKKSYGAGNFGVTGTMLTRLVTMETKGRYESIYKIKEENQNINNCLRSSFRFFKQSRG